MDIALREIDQILSRIHCENLTGGHNRFQEPRVTDILVLDTFVANLCEVVSRLLDRLELSLQFKFFLVGT